MVGLSGTLILLSLHFWDGTYNLNFDMSFVAIRVPLKIQKRIANSAIPFETARDRYLFGPFIAKRNNQTLPITYLGWSGRE